MKNLWQLTQEKVVFGAWCVFEKELLVPERSRRVKESGLDFVYTDIDVKHKKANAILNACQDAGLLALVFDPKVSNLTADCYWKMEQHIKDYKDHPALAGTVLRDEPGVYDFKRLQLLRDAYVKAAPEKIPNINLYPMYADSDQLNGVTYEEYIDQYADQLAQGYISYDSYPFYGQNGETWLRDNYLRNFEIVARACRRIDAQLWFFIQTLGFNYVMRSPNEQDIRFQCYIALSFGTRVIQLFTYGTPGNGEETFKSAMIDRRGNATPRYGFCQKVMTELNAFTATYVKYRWAGAMTCRKGLSVASRTVTITFPGRTFQRTLKGSYMDLDHALTSFDPILHLDGERPLLVGCLEKEDGRAFTLVNMEDPGQRLGNTAVITFTAPQKLRIHGKDGSRDIACQKVWTVPLEYGEGIFVEIL